ncbi:SGNH/GDSL hydrolase family protein [Saccharibacillus sacchari]|uniref:GDSL-type esterase/lipase family protein n=1 Tax=Saccharibacillus sacchari TaxID=456493 RepID=A0ACC6PGL3_9BACL
MNEFRATGDDVKKLGRTHAHNETLWLGLSGSGAEFSFTGKKAEITLRGDSTAQGTNNWARIGIWVNGTRVVDEQVDQAIKRYTVFESETDETVIVTIVKLSEAAMSTVGIQHIAVDAEGGIQPTPPKKHKIEIIGDSITCGYGIDDEHAEHSFSTATEDVTKAYSYRTVQALDADYSIVSYSGYGIISGYTDNDAKLLTHLVPDYYEKWAKSEGRPDGMLDPLSVDWDFAQFVPDLVIINLGTNDDSYAQDNLERQTEFAMQYAEFLKTVRHRNDRALILCTLGIMGDRLYPFVEQAVDQYVQETGDTKVTTLKFNLQQAEDGYAADYHPSRKTHRQASEQLVRYIRKRLPEFNQTNPGWITASAPAN